MTLMTTHPKPTSPSTLARLATWLALPLALSLTGCGSSGDAPTPTPANSGLSNPGCTISYTADVAASQTGVDPLLSSQWHLSNDGRLTGTSGEDLRAVQAWQATRGAGVRVAVIDDAVEVTHQDLAPNIVAGQSYDYRPASRGGVYPMPCLGSEGHGTAVAGIVAARDENAIGGAGVAPRASLVGYNALATGLNADLVDAINRGLDRNHVYNNSWGSTDDGLLHPALDTFITAINNGITRGRGGRGVIYVFPSGNGGCYRTDSQGNCMRENANYDGFVNQLGIIAACATDSSGKQPRYGERGAILLVCGPSSGQALTSYVRTTQISNAYRSDFSGTSASTPMVAGVATLILAANPQLTWRDVRLILARTARKNDPTDSEWVDGFGLHFNPKYGFGVADAQAAVAAATTWTSVGDSSTLKRCGPYSTEVNQALPDPSGQTTFPVSSTAQVRDCDIGQIEFVEVRVTATHAYSGDIRIRLTSPAGLVSELADARVCYNGSRSTSCGDYNNLHLGSVRHLDEPITTAGGAGWSLDLTDMATQDTGRFDRWSITFYGR